MVKIGLCVERAQAEAAWAAGFDYVELAARDLVRSDRSPWLKGRTTTTNLFFPAGVRLFGESPFDALSYAQGLFPRAHAFGVVRMVIGSGDARRAPEGASVEAVESVFVQLVARMQAAAEPWGITLMPENLNAKETNVGTHALEFATRLQAQGLRFTLDAYHALQATQPPDWEALFALQPGHLHLADRERRPPRPDDDEMRAFAKAVRDCGYEGGISVEASVWPEEFAEIRDRMDRLFR